MQTLQSAVEKGLASLREGDLATAESIFDQLLGQLSEPDINVLIGYGTVLVSQQRYGLGTVLLQTAIRMRDDIPQLWTNYACALKFLGKDEASLAAYERSLKLDTSSADTLAGIAGFWVNKAEAQKCEDYSRRALAIDPNHDAGHMHLGLALLEQGRFGEAWDHYEHRWETIERRRDKRPYTAPMWRGEPVGTLAIHGEQGLGDEIMFMASFWDAVNAISADGSVGRVVIECTPRLIPLFERSFGVPCYPDHASLIAAEGEPDAYIPMASLWRVLGLPQAEPFLKPSAPRRPRQRPLVGIAWKGGTVKTSAGDRSLSLGDFTPILATPGVDFVSVQYGGDSVDAEASAHGLALMPDRQFDTIQATIEHCDLVITGCQTAVHQCGGLGVDCWVMTPYRAAWRYCGETMPWYKTVELFHQAQGEDWGPVIAQAAKALGARYAKAA